jgi:hypothetical protein
MKFKSIIFTSFFVLASVACFAAGSAQIVYQRPAAYNWLKIESKDPRGTMIHYVSVPTNEPVSNWTQTITEAYATDKQVTAIDTAQQFHTYAQNACQTEGWSETQNSSKDITIKAMVKNCQGGIVRDGYIVMRFWQGVDGICSLSYQARLAVLTDSLKAEMVKTVAKASLQAS